MSIQKHAYYNSLRIQWLEDPTLEVEPWQVENYREMSMPLIFSRLRQYGVNLSKETFLDYSDECESPEELADAIAEEEGLDEDQYDPAYLLLFELWRRLEKDKPCLSTFCDDLDHSIHQFEKGQIQSFEELQDGLANLKVILDENSDEGADPHEVFATINDYCAHDIETFLYDFISDQIEGGNAFFASELLDNFEEYIQDSKWFELLRAKHLTITEPDSAAILLQQIAEEATEGGDLDFNIELLNQMILDGSSSKFGDVVKASLPLIHEEGDFQDLLAICIDFCRCFDLESKKKQLQKIFDRRPTIGCPVNNSDDPDIQTLLRIIEN